MPGWINIPVRIEVHERLVKVRGDKSFSDFIDGLLNEKVCHDNDHHQWLPSGSDQQDEVDMRGD